MQTINANLETVRGRIPSGDTVLACAHVRLNGENPRILAFPMDKVANQLGMPRDFDTRAAKWFVICAGCARIGDPMNGMPYKMIRLTADCVLG